MEEKQKCIYVVYTSDDRFAEILSVSLTSLYKNNKGMDQIHVYVLDSRISEENKKKLVLISSRYGRTEIQ